MQSRASWIRLFLSAMIALMAALAVPASPAAQALLRPWPANMPAPRLALTDLEGKEWDLDALRGKVVLLNFWASWCGPCIEELPFLNELASDPAMAGRLVVLGVNFKESPATIERFVKDRTLRFPILPDRSGEHFRKWATGVMPTTVLIDRDGRPRWRIVGELDRDDSRLRDVLAELLEARPGQEKSRVTAAK